MTTLTRVHYNCKNRKLCKYELGQTRFFSTYQQNENKVDLPKADLKLKVGVDLVRL